MLIPKKKGKNSFLKKLSNSYRVIVLKGDSFEEKFSSNLTPIKMIFFLVVSFFLFGLLFWLIYAHTPIKYSIPGYPHEEIINADIQNKHKADSLDKLAKTNELYYKNLKAILKGEKVQEAQTPGDSNAISNAEELDFVLSKQDSIAREKIIAENEFDIMESTISDTKNFLEELLLFKPVEGVISDGVNFKGGHYGIDVSAPDDTRVKSILNGTVIFSGFTSGGGNEVHIQHDYHLISIYKHNSAVLKSTGDKVVAGESVAIVGNSGEHSDGTHLHFEMWQKGIPLNPESYFSY